MKAGGLRVYSEGWKEGEGNLEGRRMRRGGEGSERVCSNYNIVSYDKLYQTKVKETCEKCFYESISKQAQIVNMKFEASVKPET